MDEDTRNKIRKNMTTERDFKNQLAYARKEGREEGRQEGREEGRQEGLMQAARNMKAQGLPVDMIAKVTGLPESVCAQL